MFISVHQMPAYFRSKMRIMLFFICCLCCYNALSQDVVVKVHYPEHRSRPQSDTIYYHPGVKLSWGDFKGKPDSSHFGGAITASGFAYDADISFEQNKVMMNIYVYTFFLKRDSWKKKQINSAYHLQHEQTHLDITYLGALQFIHALKQAKFTAKNIQTLPAAIFDKAYDDNTALQHQYDRETRHSIDSTVQMQWNERIAEMLQNTVAEKSEKL